MGVYFGTDLIETYQGRNFWNSLKDSEKDTKISFKNVIKYFLGNHKNPNYKDSLKNAGKVRGFSM